MSHYLFLEEYLAAHVHRKDLDQVIKVIDLGGLRQRDLTKELRDLMKLSVKIGQHYPQKTFKILLINKPMWAGIIITFLGAIMSASEKKKLVSFGPKGTLAGLRQYLDDATIPREVGGSSPVPLGSAPEELDVFREALRTHQRGCRSRRRSGSGSENNNNDDNSKSKTNDGVEGETMIPVLERCEGRVSGFLPTPALLPSGYPPGTAVPEEDEEETKDYNDDDDDDDDGIGGDDGIGDEEKTRTRTKKLEKTPPTTPPSFSRHKQIKGDHQGTDQGSTDENGSLRQHFVITPGYVAPSPSTVIAEDDADDSASFITSTEGGAFSDEARQINYNNNGSSSSNGQQEDAKQSSFPQKKDEKAQKSTVFSKMKARLTTPKKQKSTTITSRDSAVASGSEAHAEASVVGGGNGTGGQQQEQESSQEKEDVGREAAI